ncbi:MAG TPA: LUD domain-containing protein [Acidimicrobiales bacterium]|nr:LUD domain-containing protein [Acidimicrobiales bacterium]
MSDRTASAPAPLAPPDDAVVAEFAHLATDERIERAAAALTATGMNAMVVASGEEARRAVEDLLPYGAEVFNNTSRTLEAIGVAEDIERSGRYQPLRLRLYQMDREMQQHEMRNLAASPDYVVGSAHAVTEEGSLLVASASGSQLGPIVSGGGQVILVVGGQKIVPDVATAMRRIYTYCLPLEDHRAREAYGVGSGVNNVLIVNRSIAPGRITVILVREPLGF